MIMIPVFVALVAGAFYFFMSGESSGDPSRLGSGAMFDGIARVYDSANMMMSLGLHHMWKDVLVSKMEIQPGDRVLDLATGTGDIAIKLADAMMTEHPSVKREGQASPSPFTMTGSVLGLDPSVKMLDIARDKIMSKRLTGWITLMQGDAEHLDDLPDHTYDKLTISFGIRNFANRAKALDEARRVLKEDNPFGRLGVLEFVSPTEGPLAMVASVFLEYCIPVVGAIMSFGRVNEYLHLRDSIKDFPSPAEFLSMMGKAGFSGCKAENVFVHTVYVWTCSAYVESAGAPVGMGEEEEPLAGSREQ